mmetsp:Transcript_6039/g.7385  ORF Transcript_6039/g.7385 Transcript_6039/m.7385 type:complete len:232 (-) Transcript_6039:19-714(-)|eukprot:jgi/Bigna1/87993/estExt_fgenesh1_pg.C_260188
MRIALLLLLPLLLPLCRADDFDDDMDDFLTDADDESPTAGGSGQNWQNTDITTLLWKLIKDDKFDEFSVLVEKNPDLVHVRAEDGRGPLWWAYEHKRDQIIDLLHTLGVDQDAQDGDGLMAREMINGPQASKFAARLEKTRMERQIREQLAREQEALYAQYKTCASCTQAGFGWSHEERKCGDFSNRVCSGTDTDFNVEYDPEFDDDELEEDDEDYEEENIADLEEDDFEF